MDKNYLIASDWFDSNFFGKFLDEGHQAMMFLNKPQFKVAEEKITSRVLNHWHEMELLYDNREEKKGWRKFSISDSIWISIVLKLRSFGLGLKQIKKVKECLDIYNSPDAISNSTLLDFYISYCFLSDEPVKLLVFNNGEALLARQIEIDLSTQINGIKDDYISIDLGKLINKRFKKNLIKTDYLNYSVSELSKELTQIQSINEVESITIKRKEKGSYLLTTQYILENREDFEKILFKVGKHNESTIIQNGNTKIYKVVEKKRINKKGRPHNGN